MNADFKALIKITFDLNIIFLSCFIASSVSSGQVIPISKSFILFFIITFISIVPIGAYFKIYFDISRYFNFKNVLYILFTSFVSFTSQIIFVSILKYFDFNFTKTILIFYNYQNISLTHFFFFLVAINFRFLLRTVINTLNSNKKIKLKNPCLIFGAGNEGVASIEYIINVKNYNPVAFIDDDSNKIGRYINNLSIISFNSMENFIKKNNIKKIFLCLPSVSSFKLNEIKQRLNSQNIDFEEIKSINPSEKKSENFYIKENVINNNAIKNTDSPYKGKKIVITGAAGTIGEEICYQLINEKPSELILVDANEIGISNLNQKLNKINTDKIKIELILANLCFDPIIKKIIIDNKPDFIFHAAAYKHVEIVEDNPINAVYNNLTSLINVLEAAKEQKNLNFVFVSTDKAVEPINYMGKSKRLGEIITNSFNFFKDNSNKYCSVRFGNVIGSSGSLIPKIQNQINNNSEITVTDIKATRYFMTINDAVNLTLQATQLSNKGQIYVLNMGDPINIYELVKKIVKNSGREDLINKIKIVGLRNGEKLHERLYHHNLSEPTSNKLIFSEKIDNTFSENQIITLKDKLKKSVDKNKLSFIDEIFSLL